MRDRRRSTTGSAPEWPAAILRVLVAARLECPRGHARALHELTALAFAKVPARGVFDPTCRGDEELFSAIERIALAHLDLASARRAWRRAIDEAALDANRRDLVESAALELQTVSDTAYYYTGLAFGLVVTTAFR